MDLDTYSKAYKEFYITLRSNNGNLIENLIKKWQSEYSNNHDIIKIVYLILAKVYEELKLKDVPLSKQIEFVVGDALMQSRFFSEKNELNQQDVEATFDDVKKRIQILCDSIKNLKIEYYGEKNVDTKFFFVARFVAQNIHILKRQLRSTYNKLPWEEMEFCLLNFISAHTKHHEFNAVYKLVLNKDTMLYHLENFANKLTIKDESVNIRSDLNIQETGVNIEALDVNSDFPKFLSRPEAVKSVTSMWKLPSGESSFRELYTDYELIKNVYSLKRVETYVKLALSVDLYQNKELGVLVIEKALQVIGESLKNTLESPNVSDDIYKMLLDSAPRKVTEIITSLRNSLSHAYTLTKKLELENKKDPGLFFTLQNDLNKIHSEIIDILYKKKCIGITMFFNKITDSKDLTEVKNYINNLDTSNLGDITLEDLIKIRDLEKVRLLISQLSSIIKDQTEGEKNIFHEIENIFISKETRGKDIKINYITGFMNIDALIREIRQSNNFRHIQKLSSLLSTNTNLQIQCDKPEKITDLANKIYKSVKLRTQQNEISQILAVIQKINSIMEFDVGRIKAIDEFKARLEEKHCSTEMEVQEKVESVFVETLNKINEEGRLIFREGLGNKKQEYEAKLGLCCLFDELEKGLIEKNDTLVKQSYDGFIETLKLSKAKKTKLNKEFDDSGFKKCKELVHKLHNSYETLFVSVKNAMNNEKYKMSDYFKEFIKSIIKNKNRDLLNELNSVIENIFEENESFLQCHFDKRLEILTQLLKLYDNRKELPILPAIEIILLDLTEILQIDPGFADNRLFFDNYAPILIGKSLRNYLAHGDSLIDTLVIDPVTAIIINAYKFIKEGKDLVKKNNILIGQKIVNNVDDLKICYNHSLDLIIYQNEMFIAAKEGDLPKVKYFIQKGADIKGRDINGSTGLHLAAAEDHVEVMKFFLKQNLRIEMENKNGHNALHVAAKSGSINCMRYLMDEFEPNVNIIDYEERTLLHLVTTDEGKEVVEALLDEGDYVDNAYDNKLTFHDTASDDHKEVIKDSQSKRFIASAQNKEKFTPLHYTAKSGHNQTVEILLDNEAKGITNITPLHLAAQLGYTEIAQALIKEGAEVNEALDYKCTPLHLAAEKGHMEVVEYLIRKGAKVDACEDDNWTPLHYAAQGGHKDVVEILIKNGANVDDLDNSTWSALHKATNYGHMEVIEVLLARGAKVDILSCEKWTPLHIAAQNGRKDIAEVLITNEANINARQKYNYTPLHLAAYEGDKDIVEILIRNGANVNARENHNNSPLHLAALEGHKNILEALLAKEANVDAESEDKWTPLHYSALKGHKECAAVLLSKGARVDALANDDCTPLHFAAMEGHKKIIELLLANSANVDAQSNIKWTPLHYSAQKGQNNVVDVLLKGGATVDALQMDNWTPLHLAAHDGHKGTVEILITNRANVDACEKHNRTPLHFAAQEGHDGTVEMLLRKGATVNALEKDNWTPLHFAAAQGHKDIVKILIRKGAEADARGKNNWTPLHFAAQEGHNGTVEVLIRTGATVDPLGKGNQTPLHLAAQEGLKSTVEVLLRNGANVDTFENDNWTPLHFAAQKDHKGVIEVLLANVAHVDAREKDNCTPLHMAALAGHKEVVEVLLVNGAKIDACGKDNWTPLHYGALKGHKEVINVLLANKAKVDARGKNNLTPLHVAAQEGYEEVVDVLLANEATVDAREKDSLTPLHFAALRGHKVVTRVLLANEAKVDACEKGNWTPLHFAAQVGHKEVVEVLLANEANVDAREKDNWTPLHVAAREGHKEIIGVLLVNGAKIDACQKHNMTPLHWAALKGHNEVIEILLANGAKVDACGMNDWTPLHFAALEGHKNAIMVLLANEAKVDACEKNNRTPLHFAVLKGHQEAVEVLLANKANIDAREKDNLTPLHLAAQEGHKEVIEVLLANEAAIDACEMYNRTPLDWAVQGGHKDVIQVLLKKGADVTARNNHCTVLHEAVRSNNIEVIKLILQKIEEKVDQDSSQTNEYINAKDNEGDTPLMWAAEKGNINAVRILLEYGTDIDTQNNDGMTALHWAFKNSHLDVSILLINSKANTNIKDINGRTALGLAEVKLDQETGNIYQETKHA